jgi:hypothetical protein
MLHAMGIHASVLDATAVLIAVAVLGALPVGPGVGAGAMVLILGASGVAGVSAAGVLLTATGALGAVGYAAWALADGFWGARRPSPRLGPPGQRRASPRTSGQLGGLKLKPHVRAVSTKTPAARLGLQKAQTPAAHPRPLGATLGKLALEPAAFVEDLDQ